MSDVRRESDNEPDPFVEFAAGTTILDGLQPVSALFIVERGIVMLERAGDSLQITTGGVFGESALLQPPRPARAVALTDVRALRIGTDALPAVLAQAPALALPLLRQLAARAQPAPDAREPVAQHGAEASRTAIPAPHVVPMSYVLFHPEARFVLPSGPAECLVGRPDPATGATPDIDLGPFDLARSLSRRHARLSLDGSGGIAICEEPGVSNGTWLNGVRLAEGEQHALHRGDRLRFGAVEVELA